MLIILVGNKTDLVSDREVPKEEVDAYLASDEEECNNKKLLYIETSAKLGTNIHHVFTEIGMFVATTSDTYNNVLSSIFSLL